MKRRTFLAATIAGPLPLGKALAQSSADQPLRLVFPFPAGSAGDSLARLLASELRTALDQPVIVENRTGAAGRIGVQAVRDGDNDSGALLLTPSAPMVVYPHLYPNLGYDPTRDFAPVALLAAFDMAIAVDPNLPVRSLSALRAWLESNRARGHYGTPGAGTLAHLVMAALASHWSLPLVHVAYRGTPPALVDIAAGQLPLACSAVGEMLPAHRAGRVRILATSGTARSSFIADVPTLREAGIPFDAANWYGLYASSRMPASIVARLSVTALAIARSDGFQQRMTDLGFRPMPEGPATLGRMQREESLFWHDVIRHADIRVEQ